MVGIIINIYQFQVFGNVRALVIEFHIYIANETYLFQKFEKIGYPFETYGLIGHSENMVEFIGQKELFSINFS